MKRTLLHTILLLLTINSFSQKVLRGVVKNENGEVLVGANVCLSEDNTIGTTTDTTGSYVLTLNSEYNGRIQASYIGYITQFKNITINQGYQNKHYLNDNKEYQNSDSNGVLVINFQLKMIATDLYQVVITGTRTPKLLSESPIQTRLITAADIEKMVANDITDVLRQELPGVEFSYAMNQQVNMNLSGFSGQSILFLIDGERLSGETMDNVDFQRLDMNNVERIEIVKGAASALYGSAATGGVVNIITKENSNNPLTIGLNARYGSNEEKKLGLNVGLNKKIIHNMFSIQHTSIDTYGVPYNAENDFNNVYGGSTWSVKDKFVINPLNNMRITARAGYFFRERLYNEDIPDRYRDFNGGIKGRWDINERNDMEISYNFDQYDKSDYIKLTNKDIRDYSNVQNSVRGMYSHTFAGKNNILTIGSDFMHDYLYSYQFKDGAKKQYTSDVFVQYDWNINKYIELVLALRYDYFSDGQNNHLTPKLSMCYHISPFTIRAGYGSGFRSPSLKEKYMDFDMMSIFNIKGNQDLKSETSHNFNLSSEYTYDIYNFTIATYYNLLQNRITTSALKSDPLTDKSYVQYMNIENMNVYGMELTAQIRFPFGLNNKLSYCYTKEEIKQVGTLTPYAPVRPHTLILGIDYDKQFNKYYALNLVLNTRILSSVNNDKYNVQTKTFTNVKYPAYMMWKLSLSQRFLKKIKLTFTIDNLLDYRPNPYYFNSPTTIGRSYLIDLSVNL